MNIVARWVWLFGLSTLIGALWPQSAYAQAPVTTSASASASAELPTPTLPAQAPVVDQAGVLNASEILSLQQTLNGIDSTYGVRAGIVIVATAQPDGIEALANALGNEWHIGTRDGLLMVVAVQDRTARIEVSRGLEGLMPDLYVHRVLRESMSPAFAKGHYYDGLSAGLAQLGIRLSNARPGDLKPRQPPQVEHPTKEEVQGFIVAQVLLLSILLFLGLIGWLLELMRRWWSVLYALLLGGGEFGLACIFLSVPGAAVVGVVCGLLAGFWVWRLAVKLEARLREAAAREARRSRSKNKSSKGGTKKRVAAATAGAAAASSAWADSSSSSSSSSSSYSSSDSSSSSSDSSSGDFGGGGSSDSW